MIGLWKILSGIDHRLLGASWEHKGLHPFQGGSQLVLLNRAGGVDMFGTDLRTFADEGASPYSVVLRKNIKAFPLSLVTRIHVVPLSQGDGRGSAEKRV